MVYIINQMKIEKLEQLRGELISNGCINFYICGIRENPKVLDDVVCLDNIAGKWEIYYIEKGSKGKIYFSTNDFDSAIDYYKNYINGIEHWHLVVFTRSKEIIDSYKNNFADNNIKTIENNIPTYKNVGDIVFRLFVNKKDIFLAKKLFKDIPYYDGNK